MCLTVAGVTVVEVQSATHAQSVRSGPSVARPGTEAFELSAVAKMPNGKSKQKPGPHKDQPKVTVQQAVDNIVHSMRTRAAGRNRKILQWEELAQALGKGKGAARIAFLRNLNPNLRRGAFTAQEVMMVACLHLKMCRTSESPISEIGVALGTTDAHGLPLDFRSPFDISDLLRKTAEKDTPPRSAAHSLFFFHYARRLPALMARPDFEGERAADLLLWLVRSAVSSLGRGAVHDAELALLLRALCHTGQATKFGFRSNALPADMGKAVKQLRAWCAKHDDPAMPQWGRTRHRSPTQMVAGPPPADAAVHITSIPKVPAPAGTCTPNDGTCTTVDPETATTGTAERPVAGNTAPDKLLALLQAAGMGSPAGRTQMQPAAASPGKDPLSAEGRPQRWPQSPGSSGKGVHQHERPPQVARNVRQRLV